MKKFVLLIFSAISLTACFGGDGEIENGEMVMHSSQLFSISYPAGWDSLTQEEIRKTMPSGTLAAFRSVESVNGIFPNISVVEEGVSEDLLSYEYAQLNVEKAPFIIDNFNTLARNDAEIDDKETIVFVFQGRVDEESRDMQFYQTFFTNSRRGIIITGVVAIDSDQDLKDQIENALRSFSFQ